MLFVTTTLRDRIVCLINLIFILAHDRKVFEALSMIAQTPRVSEGEREREKQFSKHNTSA